MKIRKKTLEVIEKHQMAARAASEFIEMFPAIMDYDVDNCSVVECNGKFVATCHVAGKVSFGDEKYDEVSFTKGNMKIRIVSDS